MDDWRGLRPRAPGPRNSGRKGVADIVRRIAVIGAGAAGLSAAWLLSQEYDVVLFEANRRLGGHAHTVHVPWRDGSVPVDVGFIVYNEVTYPNLIGFFAALGVRTEPSDMSFSVSLDGGRLEYAGQDRIGPLFAQRRNLLRPTFLGMLADMVRFYRTANAEIPEEFAGWTVGEYLDRGRYGRAFREEHILPMAAAIWSGSFATISEFPAATFLRFYQNHGLLRFTDRPQWRTVTGGSQEYVSRVANALGAAALRTATPVRSVRRCNGGVELLLQDGHAEEFDGVVIATHAPQALSLLADASAEERSTLGAFRTKPNHAVLHSDPSLMPKRRAAWSSWNYLGERNGPGERVTSVTYWMNRLQKLDPALPLFLTLNPVVQPRPDLVLGRFEYDHPQFDRAAIAAQGRLPRLQGEHNTWFCGAWQRYGFHEDAVRSAVAVAACLGVAPPWASEPTRPLAEAA
ncbi:MAG: FAD-dependent oxidoreductase [Alphaproteobacteria bacterium]|nr:FAD-dependent oxidoreductase [Alphaproteobacteria bacterium]